MEHFNSVDEICVVMIVIHAMGSLSYLLFPPFFFSYFVLFFFILIFIKTPLEERDEGGRMEVRVEYLMIGGAAELVMLCPS